MFRTVIVGILLLTFSVNPLFARLGETLEQCIKRYGKATLVPAVYDFGSNAKELVYYNFQKNGFAIQIGFLRGKASDLSFHHAPPANALTPVEIDTLLAANAGGMEWKNVLDGKLTFFPDTSSPQVRYGSYRQRDDGAMATIDDPPIHTSTLHIFTSEWMDYINVEMKAHNEEVIESQKKNLEGF